MDQSSPVLRRSSEERDQASTYRSSAKRNPASFLCNSAHSYRKSNASVKRPCKSASRAPTGKQWHPKFFSPRVCADSPRYQALRGIQDAGDKEETEEASAKSDGSESGEVEAPPDGQDLLDSFLEDFEASIPSWEANIVRRFFQAESQHGSVPNSSKTWAWLDDREHSSGHDRAHPEALNARSLRELLSQKVSGTSIIL